LTLEEFNRHEAALQNPVERRYGRRFPDSDLLPMMFWRGTRAELEALLEEAMLRGRPVTIEVMLEAQGIKPPPPDADWF
jgi:hypothetical protein